MLSSHVVVVVLSELVVWTSTMVRTGETVAPMTAQREVRLYTTPEPERRSLYNSRRALGAS